MLNVIKYCEKSMKGPVGESKIHVRYYISFKRGFSCVQSVFLWFFYIIYHLAYNLIEEKLVDLIERIFQREGLFDLLECPVMLMTNSRIKVLTAKLLRQGYRYNKIRKAFSKFYRRHFAIVSKYNVRLKTLLLRGFSESEFYGDLVYKFRKIIGKNDFPYHFKKIIVRYKKIGYNIDVLRQTACLVVNPIKVTALLTS